MEFCVITNIRIYTNRKYSNYTFEKIINEIYQICKSIKGLGDLTIYDITSAICRYHKILITKNTYIQHKTSRNVNLRLRFLVMKRDNFKCQKCGRSPSRDPKIILHVDHILPYSKGGETILDNLQTLCSTCNLGKSNLE